MFFKFLMKLSRFQFSLSFFCYLWHRNGLKRRGEARRRKERGEARRRKERGEKKVPKKQD